MPERGSHVEIKGLDEAHRDMRRWADEVGPEVERRTEDLMRQLASAVESQQPVLTGTLAASVQLDNLDELRGWGVSLGDDVAYAGWIEFGGTRGRDYVPEGRTLQPTAEEYQSEYLRTAEDAAADSVGRFSWSTPAHI